MTIGHDQTVIAHFGCPSILAAPVNGNKFTNGSIISDLDCSGFSFIFKILWYSSDHSARENATVLADPRTFHDRNVTADPCSLADLYVLMDDTEWIDLDIGCQPGIWMNICMWMDHKSICKCADVQMCKI